MGYRPPDQSIELPARKLAEGIDNFSVAVDARIAAGDWTHEHMGELVLLAGKLNNLRYKLLRLAEETW